MYPLWIPLLAMLLAVNTYRTTRIVHFWLSDCQANIQPTVGFWKNPFTALWLHPWIITRKQGLKYSRRFRDPKIEKALCAAKLSGIRIVRSSRKKVLGLYKNNKVFLDGEWYPASIDLIFVEHIPDLDNEAFFIRQLLTWYVS